MCIVQPDAAHRVHRSDSDTDLASRLSLSGRIVCNVSTSIMSVNTGLWPLPFAIERDRQKVVMDAPPHLRHGKAVLGNTTYKSEGAGFRQSLVSRSALGPCL